MQRLATQLPPALRRAAEAHDTEAIPADPPWLRAAVPGTSMAVPQVPLTWLTTNACSRREQVGRASPGVRVPIAGRAAASIRKEQHRGRARGAGACMTVPPVT